MTEIWRIAPLAAFLLLPGLAGVSTDQLDYARLEGSSGWQTWRKVILPHLRRLVFTLVLLLTGQSLSEFDSVLILTGGGPGTRTMTPALYSYNLAVVSRNWPLGVSVAWLLEGIVLLMGVLYVMTMRTEEVN